MLKRGLWVSMCRCCAVWFRVQLWDVCFFRHSNPLLFFSSTYPLIVSMKILETAKSLTFFYPRFFFYESACCGKIRTFQGTTNYPAFLFRIQKSFVAVRKICMNQSLKRYKSNTSNRRNSKNHGIQSVCNQMWRAKKRQNFCHFYFAPESEGIFILFFLFNNGPHMHNKVWKRMHVLVATVYFSQ